MPQEGRRKLHVPRILVTIADQLSTRRRAVGPNRRFELGMPGADRWLPVPTLPRVWRRVLLAGVARGNRTAGGTRGGRRPRLPRRDRDDTDNRVSASETILGSKAPGT